MSGWLLKKRSKVNLWQIIFFQLRGKTLFAFAQAEDAVVGIVSLSDASFLPDRVQDGNFLSRYDLRGCQLRLIAKFGFEVEDTSKKVAIQCKIRSSICAGLHLIYISAIQLGWVTKQILYFVNGSAVSLEVGFQWTKVYLSPLPYLKKQQR